MAKDNDNKVVEDTKVQDPAQVNEDQNRVTTNKQDEEQQVPESARTNGEKDGRGVRTPTVGEPVTTSFDERTSAVQPFLKADGTQDNGAADLSEPEGARRTTSREGDNTTVEDTEKAIKNGDIEGKQDIADLKRGDVKAKNPVK